LAPDSEKRVLLENHYLPGDLEGQIGTFVDDYSNRRLAHQRQAALHQLE
jgi:hypothetical protein